MITIIGNSLNSTNKKILDKMNKMDFEFVKREALSQIEHGAEYVELSANSLLDNEIRFLKEAVPLIESFGGKVLVKSDNIETLIDVIEIASNDIVVGDIEFDKKKINTILKAAMGKNVKIIAQIRENKDKGYTTPEKSLLIAQMYIDYLLDNGMSRSDILLDPIVRPLEDDFSNGRVFLSTLELFKLDFPQVKTIANLAALSEGLPRRYLLSSYFVSLAIEKGLDYIVLDVMDKSIVESIISTLTIIGKDRNMESYLNYCRNSREAKRKGV